MTEWSSQEARLHGENERGPDCFRIGRGEEAFIGGFVVVLQAGETAGAQVVGQVDTLSNTASLFPEAQPGSARRIPDFCVGDCIPGNYVIRDVKRGGMGVVYLCDNEALQMGVAVKSISASRAQDLDSLQRLYDEARHWISLEPSPHVVRAFYVKRINSRPFIFMEWVEGLSLADHLRQSECHLPQRLDLAIQVVKGLQFIHSHHLCHRDLKPDNVLITGDGIAKLCDLGLAGTISDLDQPPGASRGAVIGTPAYMSPEQWSGSRDVGASTDIYAFGVMLYEMLTGNHPFPGARRMVDLYQAHTHESPRPPIAVVQDIPIRLSELVVRCMGKEPNVRPADAAEVLSILLGVYQDLTRRPWLEQRTDLLESGPSSSVLRGLSFMSLREYGRARESLEAALALKGGGPAILGIMGECCFLQQDYEAALQYTTQALLLDGENPWLLDQEAAVFNALHRPREALVSAEKILKGRTAHWSAWNNSAVSFMQLNQPEPALDAASSAIALAPHEVELWSNLGFVLGRLARPSEAIDAFARALEIDPTFKRTYYNYAELLVVQDRKADALLVIAALVEMDPSDAQARQIHNRLAAMCR